MASADLPAVLAVAAAAHPALFEREEVFAERMRLFPAGCLVLAASDGVQGYVVSHPWRAAAPVALNTLLGRLPPEPATLYLHDVALRPETRGAGAGADALERLASVARGCGLPTLSLVAVHGTPAFWRRHGFEEETAASPQLSSYGAGAVFMVRTLS